LGERKLEDFTDGKIPGVEPPQWIKDYRELFYARDEEPIDSPRYKDVLTQAMDIQAENLFLMGTVGMIPELIIAKNYIKNLPTSIHPRVGWLGAISEYNEQVYIEK
jgi:hypothetical protein